MPRNRGPGGLLGVAGRRRIARVRLQTPAGGRGDQRKREEIGARPAIGRSRARRSAAMKTGTSESRHPMRAAALRDVGVSRQVPARDALQDGRFGERSRRLPVRASHVPVGHDGTGEHARRPPGQARRGAFTLRLGVLGPEGFRGARRRPRKARRGAKYGRDRGASARAKRPRRRRV